MIKHIEDSKKLTLFFEKDSPVVKFAYGIGSVMVIGRMLYGKENINKQTRIKTWNI